MRAVKYRCATALATQPDASELARSRDVTTSIPRRDPPFRNDTRAATSRTRSFPCLCTLGRAPRALAALGAVGGSTVTSVAVPPLLPPRYIVSESVLSEANTPLVSVIVPAHNAASHLADALESLRTQTLSDIEVLVIDDGSTDATGSIAQSYAARDSRFRVFRHDPASGRPGCARNIGLDAARGTHIALLDADDVCVPTRLELSLNAVRATGASVAFGDFLKFHDTDGEVFEQAHLAGLQFVTRAAEYLEPADAGIFRCSPRFGVYLLTDIPAINTQTFFAVRTAITATGLFDESLVGSEDFDLFLRLIERFPAVYIDTVLTWMRVHATSLTATQTDRCVLDATRVRRAHIEIFRPQMDPSELRDAARTVAGLLANVGYSRWDRDDRASAREVLLESLRVRADSRVVVMYMKAWLPRALVRRVRTLLTRRSS